MTGSISLFELIDRYLDQIEENSIIAITSKVVAICEGRVVPTDTADKERLAIKEADLYLPASESKYHHHFTIVHNTILGMAGIDESNGADHYVFLPKDPQASANQIRRYLRQKHSLKNLGVIITDSMSIPLRLGAVGTCLGYSGFKAVKDYRGQLDLFGRPLKISQANIASGLAATAVLAMGEGDEQTPIVVIKEIPVIEFNDQDPSPQELKNVNLSLKDDLFAPFLDNGKWQPGGHQAR
jgi:coenzyme F420-0:L-glutamate ligase